jgi:uncharacterized integral membrane protein
MPEQARDADQTAHPSGRAMGRRDRSRLVAATVLGALIAAFALLNLDDVKVHWIVTTGQTPLIIVVIVSFLLGIGVDRLLILRAKRRRQP